jgi:hypothetical protein
MSYGLGHGLGDGAWVCVETPQSGLQICTTTLPTPTITLNS